MVRPFAVMGFTVFVVLSLIFANEKAAIILLLTAIAAFIISMFLPKLRRELVIPTVTMSVILAVMLSMSCINEPKRSEELFDSKEAFVQARIVENETKNQNGYYYNTVETVKIGKTEYKTKIRIKSKDSLHAEPYDLIECKLKLHSTHSSYNISNNIYLNATAPKIVKVKAQINKPLHFYILKCKKNIINSLEYNLPAEESSLAKALFIGDKSSLSEEVRTDFANVGIAHMTAVSGLHLSVWCLIAFKILKKLGLRGRVSYIISSVFVLLFMAVTGFPKSVVRAGIMMLLVLTGKIISQKSDVINSLGFAILVMCFINPFCVLDIGLQLSFLATLGLILGYRTFKVPYKENYKDRSKIRVYINKFYNYLLGIVMSTTFACVFTMPVTVINFKKIPVFMLSANLLLSFPAVVCMFCAGMLSLVYNISFLKFLMPIFKFVTAKSAKFILFTARVFSNIKYSYIKTNLEIFFFFLYIISLLMIISCVVKFLYSKFNFKISVAVSAILIAVFCFVSFYDEMAKVSLTVCDVGNGLAVVVENKRETALIGCGGTTFTGPANIQKAVDDSGCDNIKFMYLPRDKKSESGFIKPVLYGNDVNYLLSGEEIKELKKSFPQLKYKVNSNSDINIWKNVSLKCYTSNNESYAVLNVNGRQVLINFLPSAVLDEKEKDVIIFREKIPKGADLYESKLAVASADYKNGIYAQNKNPNVVSTGGQGNIKIEIYKDSKIKAERVE